MGVSLASPETARISQLTPARENAGGQPLTSSFIRVSKSFLAALRMASVFLLETASSELVSEYWKTAEGASATITLFLDLRRAQADQRDMAGERVPQGAPGQGRAQPETGGSVPTYLAGHGAPRAFLCMEEDPGTVTRHPQV